MTKSSIVDPTGRNAERASAALTSRVAIHPKLCRCPQACSLASRWWLSNLVAAACSPFSLSPIDNSTTRQDGISNSDARKQRAQTSTQVFRCVKLWPALRMLLVLPFGWTGYRDQRDWTDGAGSAWTDRSEERLTFVLVCGV